MSVRSARLGLRCILVMLIATLLASSAWAEGSELRRNQRILHRRFHRYAFGGGPMIVSMYRNWAGYEAEGSYHVTARIPGQVGFLFGWTRLRLEDSIASEHHIEDRTASLAVFGICMDAAQPLWAPGKDSFVAPVLSIMLASYVPRLPLDAASALDLSQKATAGWGLGAGLECVLAGRLDIYAVYNYHLMLDELKFWSPLTLGIDGYVKNEFQSFSSVRLGLAVIL
jgi:hypothetical protein